MRHRPIPIFTAFLLLLAAIIIPGCHPSSSLLRPRSAAFQQPAPATYRVRLKTTKGVILLQVDREWSPHGADRFYQLVRHGYYDSAAFFRIRHANWAQFGVAANPAVASAWRHETIPDDPRRLSNTRGTVDFAFKDPNGRTTQLFINLRDNSSTHDNEPFVPIARIIEGMDVADSLFSGYGEKAGGGIRGGKQDSLFAEGNAWLHRNFPRLDYILQARIIDVNH
ncbi:peptidylprolyl isomerase [Puia sp.]|jgi:homoserine O-acetyltransferase|uniref:peptidylprolyl isomerase n=1 Tax=Puia sp. TaxID=2045100 RepID=UPI002F3F9B98